MKTFIAATILLAACAATAAFAAEKKVKMEDLPPAVQQAIKDNTKDVTLVGISKDVENGKTEYEAETKANGHGKDITFDESGKLIAVEEEVALDSLPAPAKAAIEKQAAGGKIRKVEKVTEGDKTFYEAGILKGGKKSEALVLPDGTPTKED
ncbi:MAG TPA: PepSY-like domain-containing protein [Terriglobales bacterium]|nr:PepSY-like domain-containing protein [Terriglobales bacterium]